MAGGDQYNADAGNVAGDLRIGQLEEIIVTGAEPLVDKTSVRGQFTLLDRNVDLITSGFLLRDFAFLTTVGDKVANTFETTGNGRSIGHRTGPPSAIGAPFGSGLLKVGAVYGSPGTSFSAGVGGRYSSSTSGVAGAGVAIGTDAPVALFSVAPTSKWELRWDLSVGLPPASSTAGSFVGIVGSPLTFAGANGGLGTKFGIGLNFSIGWVSDFDSTGSTDISRYYSDGGLTTFTPTAFSLSQFLSLTYVLNVEFGTYRQRIVDNASDTVVDDSGFSPLPSLGFNTTYKDYAWAKENSPVVLTLNSGFTSSWGGF